MPSNSPELGILSAVSVKVGSAETAVVLALMEGGSIDFGRGNTPINAAGLRIPIEILPAGAEIKGTLPFLVTEATVLDGINADSAALSALEIILNTTKFTGGKMTDLKLSGALFDALKGSLGFVATGLSTGSKPSLGTVYPFKCSSAAITGLDAPDVLASFDISINNPVTPNYAMDDVTALPTIYGEGFQKATLAMKLNAKSAIIADVTDDALAQIATVTLAFTNTETSAKTLTITLTGVQPGDNNVALNVSNIIEYGYNFTFKKATFGVA